MATRQRRVKKVGRERLIVRSILCWISPARPRAFSVQCDRPAKKRTTLLTVRASRARNGVKRDAGIGQKNRHWERRADSV
jgi:hypothetical protein